MSFELVNVGSGRLATDGECIYDAFVKINNNFTNIFTLIGIEQNIITVNVNNALIITQQIQIQNTSNITMVTFSIDIDNNFIIDINFSVTMNIAVNFNINVDNSVNINVNSGDTTVNITAIDVDINTTNTIIDNSETLNVITDNSTNNYTWIFQQDGNLRLPNGGTIIDYNGDVVINSLTNINHINDIILKLGVQEGNLTLSNSSLKWKNDLNIVLKESFLNFDDNEIKLIGKIIFDYRQIENFYKSYQVKKKNRKKIEQIDLDFVYNFSFFFH